MTGVTSLRLGLATGDTDLVRFAAAQPTIYASVLEDPGYHLFRHSWFVGWQRPFPKSETFWLRGNAWVVWALVETLELLDPDSPEVPELRRLLSDLSASLLRFQKPSGRWDTIANLPGYADEETSGTAIIAAQWLRAVRLGFLAPSPYEASPYEASALLAWQGVKERLESVAGGFAVRGISGPTNPGGRLSYKLVTEKKDAGYGVGPVLLLAQEVKNLESKSIENLK
jgi:rhamnogalacturonyl hydrolase YesR